MVGLPLVTDRPWTFHRVASGIGRRVPLRPLRILFPYALWRPLFRLWLGTVRAQPDRERAMRQLLQLYDDAYHGVDLGAIDYDKGVHAKHRLTRYHDFFVERIHAGERVLDVGCGKGELAHDVAERSKAHVIAIDASPWMLEFARERFSHPNVTFVQADAVDYAPTNRSTSRFSRTSSSTSTLGWSSCAACVSVPGRNDCSSAFRRWTVTGPCHCGKRSGCSTSPIRSTRSSTTRQLLRSELAEAGWEMGEPQLNWGEIWVEASAH